MLPKEFVVNLADGRFAKLTVALVLDARQPAAAAEGGHGAPASRPRASARCRRRRVVRDIVTDTLTGVDGRRARRAARTARSSRRSSLKAIKKHTDVKVDEVLFTDIAVQ